MLALLHLLQRLGAVVRQLVQDLLVASRFNLFAVASLVQQCRIEAHAIKPSRELRCLFERRQSLPDLHQHILIQVVKIVGIVGVGPPDFIQDAVVFGYYLLKLLLHKHKSYLLVTKLTKLLQVKKKK